VTVTVIYDTCDIIFSILLIYSKSKKKKKKNINNNLAVLPSYDSTTIYRTIDSSM